MRSALVDNGRKQSIAHWASILALCALAASGCQQGSSSSAPTTPWGGSTGGSTGYDSFAQRQMEAMQDLWRKQNEQTQASMAAMQRRHFDQMAEMQRQAQEAARLAREQKSQGADQPNALAGDQQATRKELEELRRRAIGLDRNNRELHAELARMKQREQVWEDQIAELQKQVRDTGQRLAATLQAKDLSDKKVVALEASTRRRGIATITANNSLQKTLTAIAIPGTEVRQDGDVVRIVLPADKVFLPQSATLDSTDGLPMIQKVAEAIAEHYPRQRIMVDAHTDSRPVTGTAWVSSYQLTAAQAVAVRDQLVKHPSLSDRQFSVGGHGPNHPIASNATAAGQARNRRVEIVVYPETMDGT